MKVEILHITPLDVLVKAIRICYDSMDKSDSRWSYSDEENEYDDCLYMLGEKDKSLITQIIKSGHHVPLEMINVTFNVEGLTRACMLELEKHRITSITCKSSRFTLKKDLKNELPFIKNIEKDLVEYSFDRAEKYVKFVDNWYVNTSIIETLESVRKLCVMDIKNDILKYAIPDAYLLDFTININIRSLRNLLSLRTDKSALWEFRQLAHKMYEILPSEYKFLVEDCVYAESK